MDKILTCLVCGVDAPHDDANYCYCCGAGRDRMDMTPVVPKEFQSMEDVKERARVLTLARFKA